MPRQRPFNDLSYEHIDVFVHSHSPHLHHFNRDEQILVSKLHQSSTSNHLAEIDIPKIRQRQRSCSPFDRLYGKETASMRLYWEALSSSRGGERKDNVEAHPHIPRSPSASALHTRLSNTATKASKLSGGVTIKRMTRISARSRSRSNSCPRARARARSRSVDRRNCVPHSCAIPSSPPSVFSSVSFDSKQFAPSSSSSDSGYSSFNIPSLGDSDSEALSYNYEQTNANVKKVASRNIGLGLRRHASFSSTTSKKMVASNYSTTSTTPPLYERLASTNTCSLELSRKIAKAANEVKSHERENKTRGRPAFFGTVSKRSVTPIPGATDRDMQAKKSAPAQQLDALFNRLARQDTTTGSIAQSEKCEQRTRERENGRTRGLPDFRVAVTKNTIVNSNSISTKELTSHTPSLQPTSKKSDYEMDALFSRLSRQDTVASSKKIVPTPNRPEILTEYELQEMRREATVRMDYRRRRPSQDFFDGLSKDATMSLLLKQYDETHDRGGKETLEESSANQK